MNTTKETILLKSIDNYVSDMPRDMLEFRTRCYYEEWMQDADDDEIDEFIKANQFNPF